MMEVAFIGGHFPSRASGVIDEVRHFPHHQYRVCVSLKRPVTTPLVDNHSFFGSSTVHWDVLVDDFIWVIVELVSASEVFPVLFFALLFTVNTFAFKLRPNLIGLTHLQLVVIRGAHFQNDSQERISFWISFCGVIGGHSKLRAFISLLNNLDSSPFRSLLECHLSVGQLCVTSN